MSRQSNSYIAAAVAAGIAAALSIQPAAADDDRGGRGKGGGVHMLSFAELDSDGDGFLSSEELAGSKAVWLRKHDADGDGALSRDEVTAAIMQNLTEMAARMTDRMYERLDADSDGMISEAELGEGKMSDRMFDRMDDDDDGMISEAEFEDAKEKMKKRGDRRKRDRK